MNVKLLSALCDVWSLSLSLSLFCCFVRILIGVSFLPIIIISHRSILVVRSIDHGVYIIWKYCNHWSLVWYLRGSSRALVDIFRLAETHYNDVTMGTIASQITSLTIVYSTVYSDADQRKYQSSAPLAFVRGLHRRPGEFPAQMASKVENVSISWRHHVRWIWFKRYKLKPCSYYGTHDDCFRMWALVECTE